MANEERTRALSTRSVLRADPPIPGSLAAPLLHSNIFPRYRRPSILEVSFPVSNGMVCADNRSHLSASVGYVLRP